MQILSSAFCFSKPADSWPSGSRRKIPCVDGLDFCDLINLKKRYYKNNPRLLSFLSFYNWLQQIRKCAASLWWNWPKIGSTGHEIATEMMGVRPFYRLWESSDELQNVAPCLREQERLKKNEVKYSWPFAPGCSIGDLKTVITLYNSTQSCSI